MKNLLLILPLLIVGCATTPPPDPSKDFKATAAAPDLEQFIDEGNCWAGCKRNLIFSCDSMATLKEAKSCAINKCVAHYQYLKDSPFWTDKSKDAVCIAEDTSSYSNIFERYLIHGPMLKVVSEAHKRFSTVYYDARNKNLKLYAGPKRQAQLDVLEANRKAYQEARKRELIAKKASQKRLEEAKKRKAEADRKKLQEQKEEFMAYIETLKNNCKTYGFSADDAIATCVQREINLERDRVQAQQIAKQNQPIIQQVQPSYRNSGPNYDALSSMGSCLQTEGSFAACSNAWQGYTPPKKTVTKCRYDAFGNTIRGTCTTQ